MWFHRKYRCFVENCIFLGRICGCFDWNAPQQEHAIYEKSEQVNDWKLEKNEDKDSLNNNSLTNLESLSWIGSFIPGIIIRIISVGRLARFKFIFWQGDIVNRNWKKNWIYTITTELQLSLRVCPTKRYDCKIAWRLHLYFAPSPLLPLTIPLLPILLWRFGA